MYFFRLVWSDLLPFPAKAAIVGRCWSDNQWWGKEGFSSRGNQQIRQGWLFCLTLQIRREERLIRRKKYYLNDNAFWSTICRLFWGCFIEPRWQPIVICGKCEPGNLIKLFSWGLRLNKRCAWQFQPYL